MPKPYPFFFHKPQMTMLDSSAPYRQMNSQAYRQIVTQTAKQTLSTTFRSLGAAGAGLGLLYAFTSLFGRSTQDSQAYEEPRPNTKMTYKS